MIKCKKCSKEMSKKDAVCPECGTKRNWFVRHKVLTGIGIFFLLVAIAPSDETQNKDVKNTSTVAVNTSIKTEQSKSNPIQPKETEIPKPTAIPTAEPTEKPKIPREFENALEKAKTYAETMHMSKKGLYNQLTSEYGEKFSKEAAQYAIDNLVTNYNEHALSKAKTYQDSMNMSPSRIHDQLTSEYGEKFTKSQADYAIENLNK